MLTLSRREEEWRYEGFFFFCSGRGGEGAEGDACGPPRRLGISGEQHKHIKESI